MKKKRNSRLSNHFSDASDTIQTLYRLLTENTNDLIWIMELSGRFTYFSPSITHLLGYTPDEAVRKPLEDLLAPASAERARRRLMEIVASIENGQPIEPGRMDLEHIRKDHSVFWGETTYQIVPASAGQPASILGITRDITERKAAEQAQHDREQQLREQNETLLRLMSSEVLFQEDLDKAFQEITEACAKTLDIERVSIWLYHDGYNRIECLDLYQRSPRQHSKGMILDSATFPSYVAEHRRGSVIPVTDVYSDPRTRELPESYCREADIYSLLDTPVWIHERMGGLLSFEATGGQRTWNQEDERFAVTMGTLLSLCFETRERRQVERELRTSEQRYRNLFNTSPDFITTHDMDTGKVIDINDATLALFGYTREEILSLPIDALSEGSPPYSQEDAIRWIHLAAAEGPQTFEWRSRRKNGELFWTELKLSCFPCTEKNCVLVCGRDVTQRKRIEQQLQESEERLRLAMEAADIGIWETDLTKNDGWISRQFALSLGLPPEPRRIPIPQWQAHCHPDDLAEADARMQAHLRSETTNFEFEYRFRHSDGHDIWVFSKGRVVERQADGTPLRLIGILQNITERKQVEEELRRSEEKFRNVVECSPTGMYFYHLEPDGRLILKEANPAADRVIGLPNKPLLGKVVEEAFPKLAETDVPEMYRKVARGEIGPQHFVLPYEDTHFTGTFDAHVFRIGPSLIAVNFADISEKKRAEEALRQSEEKFRNVVECSPTGMYFYRLEPDGRLILAEANPAADHITGVSNKPLLGKTLEEAFPKIAGTRTSDTYVKVARGEIGPQHLVGSYKDSRFTGAFDSHVFRIGPSLIAVNFTDISEKMRAEEAIRASEEKYRTLIETTNTGFVILDSTGTVLDANAEYIRFTGFATPEELRGHNVLEWTAEKDLARNADALQKCVETGFTRNLEIDYVDRQGKIIPVEINATRLHSAEGDSIISLCRDITKRRQAEEALRQANETLQALVVASPLAIITVDPDINVTTWNPAAEKIFGWTASEIIGHLYPLAPREQEHEIYEARELIFHQGVIINNEERIRRHKDGHLVNVTLSTAPLRDPASNIVGGMVILADNTERKQAEEALRRTTENLQALITASPLAIVSLDRDINITTWNPAAERIFGWTEQEVLGHRYPLAPHERWHEVKAALDQVFTGKTVLSNVERIRQHKDGRLIHVSLSTAPLLDAAGNIVGLMAILADNTERKQAEEALRRTTENLQALLTASPLAIVSVDRDNNITTWNPAAERTFGWTEQEVLGHRYPLAPPEQWHEVETALDQVFTEGTIFNNVERIRQHKDGHLIHVSLSTAPLRDPTGNVVGLIAILTDITERKQAEEALRRTTENLQALLTASPLAIVSTDRDLNVTTWNPAAERIFGWTAQEVLGRHYPLVPPERWPEVKAETDQVFRKGIVISNAERIRRHKDGSLINVRLSVAPLCDEAGERVGAMLILADNTEYKQAEEALRRTTENLQALLTASPLAIVSLDRDINITTWNPAAERIFGWTEQEVLGHRYPLAPPERWHEVETAVEQVFTEGTIFNNVERIRQHKDGHLIYVGLSTAPLRDPTGKIVGLIAILADITERKQAEEALRRTTENLQALLIAAPLAIVSLDRNFNITTWNPAAERIFGWTEQEVLGHHYPLAPPERWAEVEVAAEQVFEKGMAISNEERIRQHKDGHLIHTSISIAPLRDAMNNIIGGMLILADITERKRAEEALQQSESLLRATFDNAPFEFWVHDRDGRCIMENTTLVKHWGSLQGKRLEETPIPADVLTIWQANNERAFAGEVVDNEMEYVQADQTRFYQNIIAPIRNGGEIHSILGINIDITDRKRAEKALRESEEAFRSMMEQSPLGTAIFSPEGDLLRVNKAFTRLWEVNAEDFQNFNIFEDPEIEAVGILPLMRRAFAGEQITTPPVEYDLRVRLGKGARRIIQAASSAIRDANGNIRFVILVHLDLTDQIRAEQELRRVKNYLSNIVNSMPTILVGVDSEERISQWNRQAELTTGISANQAVGKPIHAILPDFSPWIAAMRKEVKQRRPASMEKLLLVRDGERHFFNLMLYPLITNGIEGTVVRIEDVTEQAHIQELMVQTEKMISLGGLAAGMAHEINNPLGIITQAAQNIERRISADLPGNRKAAEELGLSLDTMQTYFQKREIPQFIQDVREASIRAAKIVANMLQFSRKSEAARQPCALADILERAVELAASDYDLKKRYDFRSIEIVRDYEADLPAVPAVIVEMEQVFLNLLKNAAQAMSANPPDRKPRITLRLKRQNRYVVAEVEDNGPGMAEAVLRRIFEPFFTTKEPGVGTGLGLSVSYMIVTQNHKGLMSVESSVDNGARFSVSLPISQEE